MSIRIRKHKNGLYHLHLHKRDGSSARSETPMNLTTAQFHKVRIEESLSGRGGAFGKTIEEDSKRAAEKTIFKKRDNQVHTIAVPPPMLKLTDREYAQETEAQRHQRWRNEMLHERELERATRPRAWRPLLEYRPFRGLVFPSDDESNLALIRILYSKCEKLERRLLQLRENHALADDLTFVNELFKYMDAVEDKSKWGVKHLAIKKSPVLYFKYEYEPEYRLIQERIKAREEEARRNRESAERVGDFKVKRKRNKAWTTPVDYDEKERELEDRININP